MMSRHPYAVDQWGSHPDAGNDDCWTGREYATRAEALAAFRAPVTDPDTAWIIVDGPDIHEARRNPDHRPTRDDHDRQWKLEIATQAGMAFGCAGYNDAIG